MIIEVFDNELYTCKGFIQEQRKEGINMKKTKICAIALSACIALTAFAGCDTTKETSESTEASESSSEITEESTEESQDTEESQETDESEDREIEIDQEYANTFISKFAEQSFGIYDGTPIVPEQLLRYVHLYLKLNDHESIHYANKGDLTYETFDMDTANDVILKTFGYNFTDDDVSDLPKPPTAFDADVAGGVFFEDNKIWYIAADGETYNVIAVVDSAMANDSKGTVTLNFTIYEIDFDTYSAMDIDGIVKYYRMTPDEAANDSTLHKIKTGTAEVDIAQSGDYILLAYNV